MNEAAKITRQKYLSSGFISLSDREKLILLLSYTERGDKAEHCADRILSCYGSFHAAADSDPMFIINECGTTPMSAILLNSIPKLRRRCELNDASKYQLNDPENAKNFFTAFFRGSRIEISAVAAVNSQFSITKTEIFGLGGFSEVRVKPRDVVEFAEKNKCPYIFISHCHPCGDPTPSKEDINTTHKIINALSSSKAILVDHIIAAGGGAVSLREQGYDISFEDVPSYGAERVNK